MTLIMDSFFKKIPDRVQKHNLLNILQDYQDEFGYIDQKFIEELSPRIGIPAGKIYGITSFYNQFRFIPKGEIHIKVCNGAACHVNSETDLISEISQLLKSKDKGTSPDGRFSLEVIPCMGACASGPVMSINDNFFTNINIESVKKILSEYTGK